MKNNNLAERPYFVLNWREQMAAALFFLGVSLLLLPTFWPQPACGHDFLTHVYRVAQIGLNAQEGVPLFHQWGQHFVRGYGNPIFAFYAPVTYWLATPFHLVGLEASSALRLVAWLAFFLAGWGAYNLGRCYFTAVPAFIVGLAYLFAPYLLYNATQRGAIPELLGLALLPWALAAGILALARPRPRQIILAGLAFGLLVLTHNVIPNFGLALLLLLAIGQIKRDNGRWHVWPSFKPAVAIILLALGLSLFFWLPALVELSYTQSGRTDAPFGAGPEFGQHFLPVTELVRWPQVTADPTLLNPPLYRYLGVGQSLLTLLGIGLFLLRLWWRRGPVTRPALKRSVVAWVLVVFVTLFFATPHSRWFWLHLPLPELVQLPTRLLGPASLAVALLAGLPVAIMGQWLGSGSQPGRWGRNNLALLLGCGLAVSVSGWPWLYPVRCDVPGVSAQAVAEAMQWTDSGQVLRWGGEGLGETLPRWVDQLPPPAALMPQYEAGPPINRLVLLESVVSQQWQPQPRGDRYLLTLSEETAVTYRAFYFPGWRAQVNEQPSHLLPRADDGLMELTLPAGEVVLELSFGPTPLRVATQIATGLLLLLCLLGWWRWPDTLPLAEPMPDRASHWALLLLFGLLLVGRAVVDYTDNPIRSQRLVEGQLRDVAVATAVDFGGEFVHLGYDGPSQVAADAVFTVTQYWQAQRAIGVPYGFRLQIADEAGHVWNKTFDRPFGYADFPGHPGWQTDKYARDAYELRLLPGTPPGRYWLEAELFRLDVAAALIPTGGPTAADPRLARIGQLEVIPGNWNITAGDAAIANVLPDPVVVRPDVALAGWSGPEGRWQPGDDLTLTLLWTAVAAPAAAHTTELLLYGEDGELVARQPILIGGETYPTSEWPARQWVRQQITWRLPATLESGRYTWQLATATQPLLVAMLDVTAPTRQFEPPPMAQSSQAELGPVRLAGFTHQFDEAHLSLSLVWQTTADLPRRYRVFVHLLNEGGELVAQSDAEPAQWGRPTTGWVVGEYVVDDHTLSLPPDLPPGGYRLTAGLYEPGTGQRLGMAELITLAIPGGAEP